MSVRKPHSISLAVVLLCIAALPIAGQNSSFRIPTEEEFAVVYEAIFPSATKSFDPKRDKFAVDVRISPSFGAPSQLSLTERRNGGFDAQRYELKDRSRSLFEQLTNLPDFSDTRDYQRLAQRLAVENGVPKHLKAVRVKINNLFRSTSFRQETNFTLDGTAYEIWYVDNGSSFHFSQVGSAKHLRGESALITFIRQIMSISRSFS